MSALGSRHWEGVESTNHLLGKNPWMIKARGIVLRRESLQIWQSLSQHNRELWSKDCPWDWVPYRAEMSWPSYRHPNNTLVGVPRKGMASAWKLTWVWNMLQLENISELHPFRWNVGSFLMGDQDSPVSILSSSSYPRIYIWIQ